MEPNSTYCLHTYVVSPYSMPIDTKSICIHTVHCKRICNESAVKQLPSQTESASALHCCSLQSMCRCSAKKGEAFLMQNRIVKLCETALLALCYSSLFSQCQTSQLSLFVKVRQRGANNTWRVLGEEHTLLMACKSRLKSQKFDTKQTRLYTQLEYACQRGFMQNLLCPKCFTGDKETMRGMGQQHCFFKSGDFGLYQPVSARKSEPEKGNPRSSSRNVFSPCVQGVQYYFFLFSRIVYVDTLSPYKHILQLHDTISLSVQRTEEGVSLYCAVAKKVHWARVQYFFSGLQFCHENFPKCLNRKVGLLTWLHFPKYLE